MSGHQKVRKLIIGNYVNKASIIKTPSKITEAGAS